MFRVMTLAFTVSLLFVTQATYAYGDFESGIQHCHLLEFEFEQLTSAEAIQIADCYTDLANVLDNHNTLLQYADSWYVYAAMKGHPYAESLSLYTRQQLAN